jgi:predicted molibdopterin-dependent oxidoreductase YjgC
MKPEISVQQHIQQDLQPGRRGRFVRLGEVHRPDLPIWIDGIECRALEGDTVLVAVLSNAGELRHAEFSEGVRAGFCLMGACQDCWIRCEDGERLRACSTPARAGMHVLTGPQEVEWASRV